MLTRYFTIFRRFRGPRASVGCAIALGLLARLTGCQPGATEPATEATRSAPDAVEQPAAEPQLPKLLDLGATQCIPCKRMAPILEEMREEYAGRMEVVFVDVWQNPDAARPYSHRANPDADLFRRLGQGADPAYGLHFQRGHFEDLGGVRRRRG